MLGGAAPSGANTAPPMAAFEAIFGPDPRHAHATPVDPIDVDLPLVLPADDAQARAIRRCLRGESIIIQGPPGTGKSQTITNLIAAMVASGKRVLFACEKRAALDVVSHRLRQAGLGELVATIHDSQLDRKEFVVDLGLTDTRWLEDADDEASNVGRTRSLLSVSFSSRSSEPSPSSPTPAATGCRSRASSNGWCRCASAASNRRPIFPPHSARRTGPLLGRRSIASSPRWAPRVV